MAACNSYYQDEDERTLAEEGAPAGEPQADNYTGPRTLDGRPAPQAATAARSTKSQPKKRGIATLGSLGGGSHHHDDDHDDDDMDEDDDDEGRGNLFAGGEKSGLAVQDPKQQEAGPKRIINDILAKAKA
jgi:UBX domain-containing protein 1